MECECKIPNGGFCERHRFEKYAHLVVLCNQRGSYWQAWEKGRTSQSVPSPEAKQKIEARRAKQAETGKPRKSCGQMLAEQRDAKEYRADNAEFIASLCKACNLEGCQKTRSRCCPIRNW